MQPSGKQAGKLIVFEGIDGAGKSTQLSRAAEWLQQQGWETIKLREPTDSPPGRQLRDSALQGRLSALEECALFIADRRWNVKHHLQPALNQGKIVLQDRYYFSTIAYQSARGLDPAMIRQQNEAFAPPPELLLLFDLDPQIALQRIEQKRGEQPNLFEQLDYLRRVREVFLSFPDPFIRHLDATLEADRVWEKVKEALAALLL